MLVSTDGKPRFIPPKFSVARGFIWLILINTPREPVASQAAFTDFEPPAEGYFFLDHDQRDTLSTGYDMRLPWSLWTSGNLNFGSGFLNGDGPQHLPSHTTFDFSIGKNIGERLSLSFTAINISDNRYLLDTSNTFGNSLRRAAPIHWFNSLAISLLAERS